MQSVPWSLQASDGVEHIQNEGGEGRRGWNTSQPTGLDCKPATNMYTVNEVNTTHVPYRHPHYARMLHICLDISPVPTLLCVVMALFIFYSPMPKHMYIFVYVYNRPNPTKIM